MWLHRVLDAAHGIFSCGMWKLVPQPGVKPRAPCIWSHQGSPLSPLLMGSHGRSLWSVSQAAQLLGQSPALYSEDVFSQAPALKFFLLEASQHCTQCSTAASVILHSSWQSEMRAGTASCVGPSSAQQLLSNIFLG